SLLKWALVKKLFVGLRIDPAIFHFSGIAAGCCINRNGIQIWFAYFLKLFFGKCFFSCLSFIICVFFVVGFFCFVKGFETFVLCTFYAVNGTFAFLPTIKNSSGISEPNYVKFLFFSPCEVFLQLFSETIRIPICVLFLQ